MSHRNPIYLNQEKQKVLKKENKKNKNKCIELVFAATLRKNNTDSVSKMLNAVKALKSAPRLFKYFNAWDRRDFEVYIESF